MAFKRGACVDVFEVAPWVIKGLLWRAVEACQWRQIGQRPGLEHLADGGVLEPLAMMTKSGTVGRKIIFGRQVQALATAAQHNIASTPTTDI